MQVDGVATGRFDTDGAFRFELPGTLTTDSQVAVALFTQPGQVGFGGDAGIHHDQRALWRP